MRGKTENRNKQIKKRERGEKRDGERQNRDREKKKETDIERIEGNKRGEKERMCRALTTLGSFEGNSGAHGAISTLMSDIFQSKK